LCVGRDLFVNGRHVSRCMHQPNAIDVTRLVLTYRDFNGQSTNRLRDLRRNHEYIGSSFDQIDDSPSRHGSSADHENAATGEL
jgi:hypothetical protein